jgi:hypothetical protein
MDAARQGPTAQAFRVSRRRRWQHASPGSYDIHGQNENQES